MKLVALCIIIHPLLILSFTALAVTVPAGLAGITNPGYHGLTQVCMNMLLRQPTTVPALRAWLITASSGISQQALSCSWGGICPWCFSWQ